VAEGDPDRDIDRSLRELTGDAGDGRTRHILVREGAVRDLPVGHVIVREDVTVKRPGDGIPAARLAQVVGKRLFRAVRTNHLIYPGDIDL